MLRPRITKPQMVRSTDPVVNGTLIRQARRRRREVERTKTIGTFIRNAFGTKRRFIYIAPPEQ